MPSYLIRKAKALENLKEHLERMGEDPSYFPAIRMVAGKAIDFYMCGDRRCPKCRTLVSNYSKSGLCKKCYNKLYMRKRRKDGEFARIERLKMRQRRRLVRRGAGITMSPGGVDKIGN